MKQDKQKKYMIMLIGWLSVIFIFGLGASSITTKSPSLALPSTY